MLDDAQSKSIRVEGWVCWFDWLGQDDVLWFTGGAWVWVIFGCHVYSMFDVRFYWQGIKIRWLSISDFNRRSGSRFAIVAGLNCVIDWWFTLFVYQESWSSIIDWYWYRWDQWWNQVWSGWVKSRTWMVLLWFSGRRLWWPKMKLEMWVSVVWIKNRIFVESRYRLVVYSVGWLSIDITLRFAISGDFLWRWWIARFHRSHVMTVLIGLEIVEMASPLRLIDSESICLLVTNCY